MVKFKIEKSTIVLALLSALWALVPILTSYSTNMDYIGIAYMIPFAIMCVIGTFFIFLIIAILFKSPLSAFASCVIGWISMSAAYDANNFLRLVFNSASIGREFLYIMIVAIYVLLTIAIMILTAFAVKKLVLKFKPDTWKISILLSILLSVMLIVSLVPIVCNSLQSNMIESENTYNKTEFNLNSSLPKPNIYWIHAESMVNENTLEKYWGNDTFGLTNKLEEKSFYVNQNADLIGGATLYALAELMCPSFYDKYEQYYLDDRAKGGKILDSILSTVTSAYSTKNEFLTSLDKGGYSTSSVGVSEYTGSTFQNTYIKSDGVLYNFEEGGPFLEVRKLITFIQYTAYPIYAVIYKIPQVKKIIYAFLPSGEEIPGKYISDNELNSIVSGTDWIPSYDGALNLLEYSLENDISPKFVYIETSLSHYPYLYDEYGNLQNKTFEYRLLGYYEQYLFSEKLILYMVEKIQEKDPNAIIIVQGDHGTPFIDGADEHLKTFGSDASSTELQNHVLSAVYIPEQYRTEGYEEILSNPLNIARYLVNNFVGQNYEYK